MSSLAVHGRMDRHKLGQNLKLHQFQWQGTMAVDGAMTVKGHTVVTVPQVLALERRMEALETVAINVPPPDPEEVLAGGIYVDALRRVMGRVTALETLLKFPTVAEEFRDVYKNGTTLLKVDGSRVVFSVDGTVTNYFLKDATRLDEFHAYRWEGAFDLYLQTTNTDTVETQVANNARVPYTKASTAEVEALELAEQQQLTFR